MLFDFDGTLGDSYPAIAASVNHVRAYHQLAPLTVAEVCRNVGRGPHYLLSHTVPAGDVHDNVARYLAHHPSVFREKTVLMPGANEVVRTARRLGLRLGVCSNKPVVFTRELLTWLKVADFFDVVLGPEDVPQPKPAPDMLLTAVQRLALAPRQALYVGDMGVDVQTARAAGVPVWIVATGSDEEAALVQAGPDRLFRDLTEVDRALQAWLG